MITEGFRKEFKSALGQKYRYTPKVLSILKNQGVERDSGKPFSNAYIRMVFNGKEENSIVEDAIYWCYVYKVDPEAIKNMQDYDILFWEDGKGGHIIVYINRFIS